MRRRYQEEWQLDEGDEDEELEREADAHGGGDLHPGEARHERVDPVVEQLSERACRNARRGTRDGGRNRKDEIDKRMNAIM